MSKVLPQHFGKYILMRKIAMGGMAEIFKAKVTGTEGFEKDLVIKRILPHFTEDEAFVKMFIDEASITAKLQHPNIVQIFDFDVAEGTYYIAMEYIEGRDLKDVLERSIKLGEPLSVAQCVWILMETSKGLHYAHTKEYRGKPLNIVHRDISPSNVMVAFNGEVKLMDFGIAKAAQRSTKTMAGAVKGKVAYMSPEQARGKPLDGRSDLFALGIMLWEMLTGKRLFLAESDFETLTNVLKAEAPPPSSINPAVPADLDPIVLKCIEKKREDRYPNVEAFNRELTRWYYSNVIDLEKEKLRPLMSRLFKSEIDEVERYNEEERVDLMGGTASGAADATAMMPAAADITSGGGDGDQRTRIDASAMDFGGPAPPDAEARTRAMPAAMEPPAPQQPPPRGYNQRAQPMPPPQQQRRGSRLPLILFLVLLLVGGGGAAVFFATQGNDNGNSGNNGNNGNATTEAPRGDAMLRILVDPKEAKVKIDGEVAFEKEGLELGQAVRVTADAPGFESYSKVIKIEEKDQFLKIQLEKEAKYVNVVVQPSDDTAIVYANSERLGAGPQSYRGKVGDSVLFRVEPVGGGQPVTQTVVLAEDVPIVKISVRSAATLLISVLPAEATVEASAGTVEAKETGLFAVNNLELGSSVDVTISATGYKREKRTVGIAQATETLKLELEKAAPGKGSIKVGARPWAQVTMDGRPYGTTPVTIPGVSAGRHRITLKQGSKTKTQNVMVKPGQEAKVYVDFTTM
ncbi:MAG: PEGA domain-containing protein [Deltaproteobacteria bacterium]|nr:MAG: PEGA domain-containing protein [Deltaproteobacteria bacterium]